MALKNQSEVSMISGPEFINLQPLDINPLMSKCQIKVFYLGHNRNGSYINRDTAISMSKTLRGTPIVAAYNKDKKDFGDHGDVIRIEDGEVHFECKTIPYGFVSPTAEVWFQNFTDTDEFGNQVERTYLMTTGYLWDGQYQELKKVLEEGQPHSMELDHDSLDGHWAKDNNLGVEFFIINDAVFSKLCILGDDVEPCFEGSSVTATSSEVQEQFNYNNDFSRTLFSMMKELTDAIQSKGGLEMSKKFAEQTETVDGQSTDAKSVDYTNANETVSQVEEVNFTSNNDDDEYEKQEEEKTQHTVDDEDDYEVKEDDQTKHTASKDDEEYQRSDDKDDDPDDDDTNDVDDDPDDDDDDKKPASRHSLEEFEALTTEVESLRAEVAALREFKLSVENEQKDALMNSWPYNTLSAEDTADVVAHKSEYSLDEIKAKLAVIYVEKGVQFAAEPKEQTQEEAEDAITTFSLDGEVAEFESDLQRALRETRRD